jgi:hypothetical protein
MAIAIPSSLKVSVVSVVPVASVASVASVAISVVRLVLLGFPVAPALGLLDALPLGNGGSVGAGARRILLEPRLQLAARQSILARGIRILALLVLRMTVKSAVTAVGALSVIPHPAGGVVAAAEALGGADADAAHASLEALGALGTKALARLHGAPALGVLVLVTASAQRIVSAIPHVSAEPVAGGFRIVGAVAEIKAVGTILSLRVPESLLDFASTRSAP